MPLSLKLLKISEVKNLHLLLNRMYYFMFPLGDDNGGPLLLNRPPERLPRGGIGGGGPPLDGGPIGPRRLSEPSPPPYPPYSSA